MDPKKVMYAKRGQVLVQNLKKRHFEAFYCESRTAALEKALELIPEGASVGWGGAMSAEQIGLMDALWGRDVKLLDRSKAETPPLPLWTLKVLSQPPLQRLLSPTPPSPPLR